MTGDINYDIITHRGSDITSVQIMDGNCEDAEIRYLREMLYDGDHVLDFGGNIGLHAVNFAQKIAPLDLLLSAHSTAKNTAATPLTSLRVDARGSRLLY